jgi:hypothetical protein
MAALQPVVLGQEYIKVTQRHVIPSSAFPPSLIPRILQPPRKIKSTPNLSVHVGLSHIHSQHTRKSRKTKLLKITYVRLRKKDSE